MINHSKQRYTQFYLMFQVNESRRKLLTHFARNIQKLAWLPYTAHIKKWLYCDVALFAEVVDPVPLSTFTYLPAQYNKHVRKKDTMYRRRYAGCIITLQVWNIRLNNVTRTAEETFVHVCDKTYLGVAKLGLVSSVVNWAIEHKLTPTWQKSKYCFSGTFATSVRPYFQYKSALWKTSLLLICVIASDFPVTFDYEITAVSS